jgi:hypothetical protein
VKHLVFIVRVELDHIGDSVQAVVDGILVDTQAPAHPGYAFIAGKIEKQCPAQIRMVLHVIFMQKQDSLVAIDPVVNAVPDFSQKILKHEFPVITDIRPAVAAVPDGFTRLLIMGFFYGCCYTTFNSNVTLLVDTLGIGTASQAGYLSSMNLFMTVLGGLIIVWLLKVFKQYTIAVTLFILGAGLWIMSISTSLVAGFIGAGWAKL